MSDPIESSQPEIIARILGALTLVLGAIAGLWRTIFGSKAERVQADAQEDDALKHAAEIALRNAERAEREAARAEADTKSVRVERDDCTARLAAHEERSARERAEDRARIAALESGLAEHSTCGPRIKALEDDVALSKRMLADYMGTTPRHGIHPDEVRAEMARQET